MKPRSTALATPAGRAGPLAGTLHAGIAAVLISAAIGLAGCTPDPAPQPTPTPLFASEAEAFTAAEQVYRDYVEAANAQQNGDANADPQRYLAGAALDDDVRSVRDFEKSGLKIVGQSTVKSFSAESYNTKSERVQSLACLDVSQSRVMNSAGVDVTPTDRPGLVGLSVAMTPDRRGLKIVLLAPNEQSCR